jgi:NADPH-dependent 2,4-dienoyl-CoA reductase/sulfur reductase-like enzyme
MEAIFRKGRIECLVNPMLGREKEMAFVPTRKPRKIMVVGGGPGGLNLAWVAAKRGHEVHVFEKRNSLGGQLLSGSIPMHKKELNSLIKFQEKQIEKFGVRCHLNHAVKINDIQALDPDVVVLATGSLPAIPPVEGNNSKITLTYADVLNGIPPTFKEAVVIGGGATGLEIALYLAGYGCQVSIVEMLARVGGDLEAMTKRILLRKLNEHNVKIMTETKLIKVESAGAAVICNDGTELVVEAERVIFATGTRPYNHLYEKVKSLGYETHQIGDCLKTRNAKAAIYESAVLGRRL